GYKALNAEWADAAQKEDALEWSKSLFKSGVRPEEAKAEFDAMTPAQKQGALVSVYEHVMQTIEATAKTGERSANVARPFTVDLMERRLRAVLGDKADDLFKAVRGED